MKQILALSAAAMLLGVVSCSQEDIAGPQRDGNACHVACGSEVQRGSLRLPYHNRITEPCFRPQL